MAYIEHALGRTHYTRKGRKTGKTPVIWLHGGPGGMHSPDHPVFQLATDRPVYAYTQLGSGRSSATTRRFWTIPVFVRELALLVEAWELEEFHLMGGSWGTTLALEYYLRRRGKGVRSLVFQSPLFSARHWKADGLRLMQKLPARTRKIIQTCQEIGATDSKVYWRAMDEYYSRHVHRRKRKKARPPNPNGRKIYEYMWGVSEVEPLGTLKGYTRLRDLPRIRVPSLIICGEHDEATPATARRYAERIPDCRFEVIDNASHVIWEEKPGTLRKVINRFLRSVERN